jgi:hypothetical protein
MPKYKIKSKNNKYILLILTVVALCLAIYIARNFGTIAQYGAMRKPVVAVNTPLSTHDAISEKDMPIPVNIPEGAGHLVEGYTAPGEGANVIIHIQDIHTNYEAQKNLSKILELMIKENGLKLIMVEGGWGDVSLSYLRSYADSERRQEVAEEYLREGKISGEEYLDIVSSYDITLEGIEDEELYKKNLDTFFEIETFRHEALAELEALSVVINQLKQKLFSPQLIELEKIKQDYDNENITLAEYYRYLHTMASRLHQNTAAYPNFARFMAVIESERAIQFPVVEKERAALIERLSKNLSKQELTTLVTKSLEFRLNKMTPIQYHTYLMNTADKAGEQTGRYTNLEKYIEYIRANETIDTAMLFEEADALLRAVEDALIKGAHQKQLYGISRSAQVLYNFLHIKLVPADFKYYKNNRDLFVTAGWIDFLTQQSERGRLRTTDVKSAYTLDKNLSALVRFYDLANVRDDAFVQNAIRLMERDDTTIAVLIAGGFHTPNLKQKFKEHGLSYVVVAPHTTQQTDPEQYRYILKYKSGRGEQQ